MWRGSCEPAVPAADPWAQRAGASPSLDSAGQPPLLPGGSAVWDPGPPSFEIGPVVVAMALSAWLGFEGRVKPPPNNRRNWGQHDSQRVHLRGEQRGV